MHLPPGPLYTAIGILAAVENIFPPIPADTAVALGAFLSAGGVISARMVFAVTWAANVTSAAAVYFAARKFGRPFFRGRVGRQLLRPKALARLEREYGRHHTWGIFISRFIPAVRAVVPPFAGLAGIGAVRTLVPLTVASAIWYGMLTFLASRVVQRFDEIVVLLSRINRAGLIVGGVVLALVAVWWIRHRRARRELAEE